MKRSWIRKLLTPRPSTIRTRVTVPQLLQLEARENPALFFVSPTFTAVNGTVVDGDLVAAGAQNATIGIDAFAKLSDAVALAVNAGDEILVNEGDYTTSGAVTITTGTVSKITFQGASATVVNLDYADPVASLVLNTTLTFGNAASTTIAAPISGTNGFVKQGSGKLTLTGANTFAGVATVNAGVVYLDNDTALGAVGATNNTVVADGAALEVGAFHTYSEAVTLAGNGISNGGALRRVGTDNAIWSGAITLAGTGARINADTGNPGTLLTISGAIGGTGKQLALGGDGDMLVSGLIGTSTGGTLIKDGLGRAELTNASNNFGTGATATSVVITVNSGILAQNGESSATVGVLSTTGPIPAVTVPSYVLLNGGTLQGTRVGVGVTFLATPKGITLGVAGGKVDVFDTTVGNLNIYSGVIAGTAGGSFTRLGQPNSVFAYAGAATYNGPTIVDGGILRVRTSTNRFPITTALSVNSLAGAIFDLNGVAQQVATITGGPLSQINLGSAQLTVGNATDNVWDGFFTGTGGGVTKVGTGKLTLTNGNSANTGTSNVNGGTLELANTTGNALGSGGVTVGTAGTLTSTPAAVANTTVTGTVAVNGILSPGGTGVHAFGTGALTMTSTGTLAFQIANNTGTVAGTDYDQVKTTGNVTLNNGILSVTAAAGIPLGAQYTIIDNGGLAAMSTIFFQLGEGAAFTSTDGQTFKISYIGGDGNDIVITKIATGKTLYVSPNFTLAATDLDTITPGIQVDGDLVAAGVQTATVDVTAFATVNAAYAAAVDNDFIIINNGIYPEAVQFDKILKVTVQTDIAGGGATFNSLAGTASGNLVIIAGGTNPAILRIGDATSTTYAGILTGAGSVIKDGTGTLTLSSIVNNYTGVTTIVNGTMTPGAVNGLSTASAHDLTALGRIKLNGFNATVANLTGVAGAIVENDSLLPAVLSAGSAALNVNYLGTLQDGAAGGTFGFVKLGTGTLTLPPVNTFTGPFTLQGGSYSVATFPNGGVPGPFGASTNAKENFTIRTTSTLTYTGPSTTTDRNILWGIGTISVSQAASTLTIGGTLSRVDTTVGSTFTKSGPGGLTFTATDAFQTPNDTINGVYGVNQTGNITVSAGNLTFQNLRINGTTRAGGSRIMTIATGATATALGTVSVDPTAAYTNQIVGPGTLQLRNASASKANPTMAFDAGPTGGNGAPFGSIIGAPLDFGNVNAVFVGKSNRNNVNRYSGDARFDGAWTGTGSVTFIGISSVTTAGDPDLNNKFDMAYALNADNTAFTGAVTIANSSLSLGGNTNRLSANNSVTFASVEDSNTTNNAYLYLWGRGHTIGSLNDLSAANTKAYIRNGSYSSTNGLTNTLAAANSVALGTNADAALIVVQTVPGTFKGIIGDGPNDLGVNGTTPTATVLAKFTGITKQGAAKLTLTGANTHTNTTNVSAGTLEINGNLTKSAVLSAAASTVGGTGTIVNSSIGGKITGGTDGGAGILSTTGNLVVQGTGTVVTDVTGNGTVAGTDFDQLNVTGTVTVTGATLTVAGTGTPTIGTPLVIINNDAADAVVGKFANFPNEGDSVTVDSSKYVISYVGGDGNDVTLTRQNATANVTSFTVNNGDAQRSRITTITLNFDAAVVAANFQTLGTITLTRTGAATIPTGSVGDIVQSGPAANNHITVAQGTSTSLVLTFDNNGSATTADTGVESGSLSDGYWRLQVGTFQSALNDLNLRRLYGDSTSSAGGTVDGSDLTDFGNSFNASSIAYDFNNDGVVDGSDLTAFGNRFGNVL